MPLSRQATKDWALLLSVLAVTLAWDVAGFDLAWARWYGNMQGFALRNDVMLQYWFHDVAQNGSRVLFGMCIVMIFLPLGVFKRLSKGERVHLVVATLFASLCVVAVKQFSMTSCPWSLSEFGGTATYVGHWQWGMSDGGGGRCFPGGHASSGFAFVAAAFWIRLASKPVGMVVWFMASAAGLVLGVVQQMRGAHFFSHTLWAWLLCCAVGVCYFYAVQAVGARKKPA
jgi:membrane-associated PAP2 superfamily phosphatase